MAEAVYDVTVTELGPDGKDMQKSIGSTTYRVQDDRISWIPNIGVSIEEIRAISLITFTKKA